MVPLRDPLLLAAEPPLTEQLTVQVTVADCPLSGVAAAVTETDSGSWISEAKPHAAGLELEWHC